MLALTSYMIFFSGGVVDDDDDVDTVWMVGTVAEIANGIGLG